MWNIRFVSLLRVAWDGQAARQLAKPSWRGAGNGISEQQHAVSVGEEAVTEADGVGVGGEDGVEAGGCAIRLDGGYEWGVRETRGARNVSGETATCRAPRDFRVSRC